MIKNQDLPLKNDIAARFLPLIIGLMVYVGTLCFVFALFIFSATQSWKNQWGTHFTLEIPHTPGTPSSLLQKQVLQVLSKTPGIKHAFAVPPRDIENLLRSLVGADITIDPPSLPVLLEITLNEKDSLEIPLLQSRLHTISPEIHLMDHRSWQNQVAKLLNASVILISLLTFLILIATLVITTFATRTSMLIHRQVIEILYLIGAQNSYIAHQFQVHILKKGLLASAIGSLGAFLTFIGITILLEKVGFPISSLSSFSIQAFCLFALSPFVAAFFMMVTTRFIALRELKLGALGR